MSRTKETEHDEARRIASEVLDSTSYDPDSYVCVLARQLLRADERAPVQDSNWYPEDEDQLFKWGMLYAQRLKLRFEEWLVPMADPDAPALKLARVYWVVKNLVSEFEEAFKVLEAQKGKLGSEVLHSAYERDKAGKTLTVKFDGTDYRVTLSAALRASIKKDVRDEAHEWLRDHKLGDLITSTVNAQTLSAAAGKMADDNMELPESLFSVFYQNTASVTKVK